MRRPARTPSTHTPRATARLDLLCGATDAGHHALGVADGERLARASRARLSSAEVVLPIPHISQRPILSYLRQDEARLRRMREPTLTMRRNV